jgi:aryl-alcohol dehydrogenase
LYPDRRGRGLNAFNAPAGTSIAVFGTGLVGLSAITAAKLTGCTTIVAIDVQPSRLELAKALGATVTVDPRQTDPVDFIRSVTAGRGAGHSLETTALPTILRQTVDCVHVRGICGLLRLPPGAQRRRSTCSRSCSAAR